MADADKPTPPLIPGTQLGRYRIETLIGTGGMASVYRAFDTVLQRPLAIKVLERTLESAGVDERLLREAQTASALSHSNICTVYEIGSENGLTFIAMEFVDGPALAGTLATGSLSVDDTLRYGIALASALAHAHERGVIHRDLKAANVILSSSSHPKIVDFGLARRLDAVMADAPTLESLAPAGSAIGTPYAMAPEQVRGAPADARSDVWALGAALYEMVSGSRRSKAHQFRKCSRHPARTHRRRSADQSSGLAAPDHRSLPKRTPSGDTSARTRCASVEWPSPGRARM
jgi:serine/threonine-protein kinase